MPTYLPSTWSTYTPSFIHVGIFVGTIGSNFLLFSRYFPVYSAQAELKKYFESFREAQKKAAAHH